MTKEEIHNSAPPAAATGLPMPPSQALTTRFELDAVGQRDMGLSAPMAGKPGGASMHVVGEPRQGFRIGELRLMIRYEDSSELSEMSPIHRLPNAPDWFGGVANLHGKLTPVFDLAGYLGVEPDPVARRMLLVLSHGVDATGILIDGLPERLRVSGERTDAGTAPERLQPHLRGANFIGEKLWFDLDTHSLLGAIEHSLEAPQ